MTKNGSIGFEKELWHAADQLRSHMDAAVYKHIALGLLFLKYVNDKFDEARREIEADEYGEPENPDDYAALSAFWVPEEARWSHLKANATQDDIGVRLNRAAEAIEAANESLQGVVPREFANEDTMPQTLAGLISTFDRIQMRNDGGDMFGRVYEYFLGEFARAEGKKGGQFFTPQSVVKTLVAMLEPFKGRIYDPCCGSGGMFIQSTEFVTAHGGKVGDISIYGQESNPTTWRLTRMNLALHGLEADFGSGPKDTFAEDLHPNLVGARGADYILANPPFNMKEWNTNPKANSSRFVYGQPPPGNANMAWLQHILHHLNPKGVAGVVLSCGALNSGRAEQQNRMKMLEANVIDAVVALPNKLFYTTAIEASVWILRKGRATDRVLFIDARNMGALVSKTERVFSSEEIHRISKCYRTWHESREEVSEAGFARTIERSELMKKNALLFPGRYVGFSANEIPDLDPQSLMEDIEFANTWIGEVDEAARNGLDSIRRLTHG